MSDTTGAVALVPDPENHLSETDPLLIPRRHFVRAGLASGAALMLPAPVQAGQRGDPSAIAALLDANMVYAADPVPVPIARGEAAGELPASFNADQHAVFLADVILERLPAAATLHLFAYTRYRLYVNGRYVGRGPSRFDNERPEYDSRSITALLRAGSNRIAVLAHRDAPTGRIMHHRPGFAATLEWHDEGGRAQAIVPKWRAIADRSFGVRPPAWTSIEERIDARAMPDWTTAEFDASGWPAAAATGGADFRPLHPPTLPPQDEYPVPLWSADRPPREIGVGETVTLRLPRIVQGYHRLDFDAEAGTLLALGYGLPQQVTTGRADYVARAGRQLYCGGDTFAQDRLVLRVQRGRLWLHDAAVVEVRYPFTRVGRFACSDPLLTRLWSICARTIELLSEDAYVDCADRERVEWTDCSRPAFDCTRVMMAGPSPDGPTAWSDGRLTKALLHRIALSQRADGQLKAHSCSERMDVHGVMEDRSCAWVILLRDYYESTGDDELVRDLWPTLVRLMAWFQARRTDRDLVQAHEWAVWDNPLRYHYCEGATLNALVYRATRDAAYLGRAIGRGRQATAFDRAADTLARAFDTLLWSDVDGTYLGALFGPDAQRKPQMGDMPRAQPIVDGRHPPTAQAALFALYAGIVPAGRIPAVQAWLLRHRDGIRTPMSHFYLFKLLYDLAGPASDTDALATMRRGWRAQVDSDWQTSWEELPDGGGSKCHIYGTVPGYFLSAYVLGIRREAPVRARRLVIDPRPGDLESAHGVVVTEFGPVPVAWTRRDDVLQLEVTTPDRTVAEIRVPAGKTLRRATQRDVRGPATVLVDAGRHRVEIG